MLLVAQPLMAQTPDSLHHDIELVEITASLKNDSEKSRPIASTTVTMSDIERRGIGSIKELSLIAPNFYQPDYGSSITSSIYVRGFGSRIDQPVLGLTIDDVPVMNKNSYDFDLFDIRRIELLRGPQGTLYGRNTSGGVMNITTLSPHDWQGFRGMAEVVSNLSLRASAAYYARPTQRLGISFSAAGSYDNGFFKNSYTGLNCDAGSNLGARLRIQYLASKRLSIDNSLTVGYTDEGGYAYHLYDPTTNYYNPIAYNDPASYKRLTLSDGFVLHWKSDDIRLQSTTSLQYLGDVMTLDQDFTPKSMFTLTQQQREFALTQDLVIRNADTSRRWQWLSGIFGFAKWLDMSSPVTFKRDGVNELILGNINKGIHTVFPNNSISFDTDNFVIASDFQIPVYGTALYHQSSFTLGHWRLTAGIRADLEYTTMDYLSHATLGYMFDLTMSDYKQLHTEFRGREEQLFWEILPKLSAEYNTSLGSLYATITRGYKSGGFNTQIFSDILQSKMMNDMMSALGVHLDSAAGQTSYDSASATRYKPETSWNFELGTHLHPARGLSIDAAAFWIECFDQQVTVLPKGMSTGRMMSNAARARSYGLEISVDYNYKGLNIRGDYGYTNARFRSYNDGIEEYRGKRIPYSPEHTASLVASYNWSINNPRLQQITLTADWRATGSIYWNEANTLKQPLYSLLGAQITLKMNNIQLTLWGRNLLNTRYNQFYFKSVGNEFFSKGKPLHAGLRLNINI